MKIQKFEDIIAWQNAQDFAVDIYSSFKKSRNWNFGNQICRAVVSISNNIAEGFDRSSNAEFRWFVFISFASCSEVKSMLFLAKRLDYVEEGKTAILISNLLKSLKLLTV